MNERRTQLKARFATGEKRVKKAEDEIRRVSQQRLAELMKLSERVRLEHLEDADLTLADRAKLRRSVAASLRRGKMDAFLSGGRWRLRRLWGRLRYRMPAAAIVTAVGLPLIVLTSMAWSNTGEVIILPQPIGLDWRLPSGATQRTYLNEGFPLVIVSQSGTRALARWWIAGKGYATARVNIDRHLIQ